MSVAQEGFLSWELSLLILCSRGGRGSNFFVDFSVLAYSRDGSQVSYDIASIFSQFVICVITLSFSD